MRAVLTEGAVLGMLSMLFLLGYENQQRTAAGVYASRTGRRLCRWKVLAGIAWALAIYLLLAAVTLGVFGAAAYPASSTTSLICFTHARFSLGWTLPQGVTLCRW